MNIDWSSFTPWHALAGGVGADGRDEQARVAGVQRAVGLQELVPRYKHAVQHRLPQQEVAHPLADDDVHLNSGVR